MSDKNVANYHKQGGAEWIVGSGGLIQIESGGMADFQSGSVVTLAGTTNLTGTLNIDSEEMSSTAVQLNAAPVRVISYEVEDLSAGGDIANRPIFYVPSGYKITLSNILVLSQGTAAGIDNGNTSVVDVKNGTNSIASKTFNASVEFPSIATVTNLGSLSATYKELNAGDVVRLSVTNGTSADTPGFVVELIGTIETE